MKKLFVLIAAMAILGVNKSIAQYAPNASGYDIDNYAGNTLQISVTGDDGTNSWTSDKHGTMSGIVLTVPGPDNYRKSVGGIVTEFRIRYTQDPTAISVSVSGGSATISGINSFFTSTGGNWLYKGSPLEGQLVGQGLTQYSVTGTGTVTYTLVTWDGASVEGASLPIVVTFSTSLSNDANLSSLSVSTGTLTPSFNASTTSYTVDVANSVTNLTISATANHSGASVTGTGSKSLNVGANPFNVTVTAEDGTQKTYTVTVTRAGAALSNDANLSSLSVSTGTLTPSFNASTTSYTVDVANSVTSLTISATANHSGASVTGTGSKSLNVGTNPFNVTVTAETV